MNGRKLMIGLITHHHSRFNFEGASEREVSAFAAGLKKQGLEVATLISDRDDYTPASIKITRRLLASSAIFQVWLEFRWRRYLAAGRRNRILSLPKDAFVLLAMSGKRLMSYVGPNPLRPANQMPGARQVIRLLNIDLSHLRVYRDALRNECEAVLVLEDDARVARNDAATVVLELLASCDSSELRMANLSESISLETLGVMGIVEEATFNGLSMASCSRPVTNTVCANLFNAQFTRALCEDIEGRGLTPVVPIDWRLNRFLMSAWKRDLVDSRTCIWVVPGIFIQGSMHSVL